MALQMSMGHFIKAHLFRKFSFHPQEQAEVTKMRQYRADTIDPDTGRDPLKTIDTIAEYRISIADQ
jgi:hypothetical protein